jgi:hypothetical protein
METILETLGGGIALIYLIILFIVVTIGIIFLPRVIFQRIKNKEDNYYSKKVDK